MKTKTKFSELLAFLDLHLACADATAWAWKSGVKTLLEAWRKCPNPQWMIWALESAGHKDERVLRLFACWCVRHTPLTDGRKVWDLLTDERSRNAVEVAELFMDGNATSEQLAAAEAAAGTAARAAAWTAARAAARAALAPTVASLQESAIALYADLITGGA